MSNPTNELWDIIIVGAGPAGLTAGIYAARAKRKTLIVEKLVPGGQVAITEWIENYPGFVDGVGGLELGEILKKQAERFGAVLVSDEITKVDARSEPKIAHGDGGDYRGRTVIIATGSNHRKLGVPGEDEFANKGVSYCATCDGWYFNDKRIAVVGGGDSAFQEGDFLTRYASKLWLIHRRDQFRAERVLQDRLKSNPKVEMKLNAVVEEIVGNGEVTGIRIRNTETGETELVETEGVFPFVGMIPNTEFLKGDFDLTPLGYVRGNERMETGIPGIYVAGDVRADAPWQAVTAAADGCIAALSADEYLTHLDG
ncbi:MAG: thioredoxin-disulfide reductase [Chloroflexi bacterium]|nr:thioredoxin-disulfide reductase [Chloroflexota bacterium]